ncbi:MAG TPA: protein kinase [Actinomadura sp.]|jgi:hypothetical protein|nr:protein kinase [Actinomadura sp.]
MAALTSEDPPNLGPYRLTARLGTGGFGVVYLSRGSDGALVAVKALHQDLAADPRTRERFAREVEALKRVPSHCTARVLGADLDSSPQYIVSEYVAGPTLDASIRENGVSIGDDLHRLAIGTMTALTAIHGAGVVHRDLKPANVILGSTGPRVIDFGIAREGDGASSLTAGGIIGTPAYMAPEQVQGLEITAAVDIFAWGAVMAFAGTGLPLFGTGSMAPIFDRIRWVEPDLGGLDGELRDIVASCLAKDPARRPAAKDVLLRLLGHTDTSGGRVTSKALAEGSRRATAFHTPTQEAVHTWGPPTRSMAGSIGPRAGAPVPAGLSPSGHAPRPAGSPAVGHGPSPYGTPTAPQALPRPLRRRNGPVVAFLVALVFLLVGSCATALVALDPRTGTRAGDGEARVGVPKELAGTWTGMARSVDSSLRWMMRITLREGRRVGSGAYPLSGCGGRLVPLRIEGGQLALREELEDAGNGCTAGELLLRMGEDHKIHVVSLDGEGSQVSATATLTRRPGAEPAGVPDSLDGIWVSESSSDLQTTLTLNSASPDVPGRVAREGASCGQGYAVPSHVSGNRVTLLAFFSDRYGMCAESGTYELAQSGRKVTFVFHGDKNGETRRGTLRRID